MTRHLTRHILTLALGLAIGLLPATVVKASESAMAGTASWYCLPGRSICTQNHPAASPVAAAGPALRAALGPGWRGKWVTVMATGGDWISPSTGAKNYNLPIRVRLLDWCQCSKNRAGEKLIDLYASVFRRLVPLSRGVVKVTVSW